MKYLVIGLGSMGKRRIRNLQALGVSDIAGFDIRSDRRIEVSEKYKIKTFASFEEALSQFQPKVFIISTPPDLHMHYAYIAYEKMINCFIEASVVDLVAIRRLSDLISDKEIIFAPSCTMSYFPGPKKVKELIDSGIIGEVLNINYHTGQYLPDWHPWEPIEDYYVSKRETGGAREIVPFELGWLSNTFGKPVPKSCIKLKVSSLAANIDDVYHSLMSCKKSILNMTIEVLSRPVATRELRVIGASGILTMSQESNNVKYISGDAAQWVEFLLPTGNVEDSYINSEEPYIAEMSDFVAAVTSKDRNLFPNSLKKDAELLEILLNLEALSEEII